MNIAIVSRKLSGRGGMETVIQTLGQTAQANSVPLALWAMGELQSKQWLGDIPYRSSKIDRGTGRRLQLKAKLPFYILALARMLHRSEVDTLLITDPIFAEAAYRARYLTRRRVRILSWLHFSLDKMANISSLEKADGHLAISQGIKRQLESLSITAPIHVIHNPLPYRFNPDSPQLPIPKRILYVGRLSNHQKRLDLLFQALSQIDDDWQLDIAGDGPDMASLQNMINELGLNGKVAFRGWQSDPWERFRPSALVLTSDFEGFPMVLVEALARGIPVISTNCPTGPEDIVAHYKNGLLAEVGSSASIRDALQIALENEWPWEWTQQDIQHNALARYNASRIFDDLSTAIDSISVH